MDPSLLHPIKDNNFYRERIILLGRIIDGSLIAFGFSLILTGVARLFNIYDSPLSIPQILQGLLGGFLFIFGIGRKATLFLKAYKRSNDKYIKIIIGSIPFVSFSIFLLYRLQLDDLSAYGRLVEEGSLVEWFSFLFLFLSSIFFVITGIQEANKLVRRFVLGSGFLVFILSMEEVSWGQMIFNWRSPEIFVRINSQQETNLHNLLLISGEPNTFIVTLVLFFLTISCLLRWYLSSKNKIRSNTIADIVLPPFFLIGYFSIGALLYFGLVLQMNGINIPILIPRDQELMECFFALGILIHSCRTYLNWGLFIPPKRF